VINSCKQGKSNPTDQSQADRKLCHLENKKYWISRFALTSVGGSINNALCISEHLGGTRLLISNNDNTIKVYSLPGLQRLTSILLPTAVNYSTYAVFEVHDHSCFYGRLTFPFSFPFHLSSFCESRRSQDGGCGRLDRGLCIRYFSRRRLQEHCHLQW